MSTDELTAIVDAMESLAKRISKVEDGLGSASGQEIARERRQAAREMRML